MRYCDSFRVAGKPLLIPDEDVTVQAADLQSNDSGRDESGVLHRIVLRRRVRTWSFSYAHLSAEEYQYMESVFAGLDQFEFEFPNPDGTPGKCLAYCANTGIAVRNLRTGKYRNYTFSITEC